MNFTKPIRCAYCPGTVTMGYSNPSCPDGAEQYPTVMHSMPTCGEYDAIESVLQGTRFMEAARNRFENNQKN